MPTQDPTGIDTALREITRAVRQICLLQETGRDEEAGRLETTMLAPLIENCRGIHGAAALPDERLWSIRTSERERAGDAAALGELLVPLLLEHLDRPTTARTGRPVPPPARRLATVPGRPPRLKLPICSTACWRRIALTLRAVRDAPALDQPIHPPQSMNHPIP
ncbi:MAG: hypothetical protein PHE83_09740 [Opitutaceae bacterium]|nr:hypothetical protein [Opitutaceae bacterium]